MKLILLFCLSLVLAGMCPAAIFYPKAPDAGWQIASNNLNTTFFGVSSKEDLTITVPYREYFAGASNLASGHLLSTARIGGWRYPVIFETNVVGAVELIPDGKNGNIPGFNSLQKPFFPDAPLKALRIAEQLPQVIKSDYEFRYLEIINQFVAIWLHGRSDDIIIPIPLTFSPLKAYQPYSESQIVKMLEPQAIEAIEWAKRGF